MLLKCCWSNKKNSFNWEKAQHNYTVWPASVGQRCPQVTSSIAFFTPSVPTVMPVYKGIFCTVNDTNWVETDIIWLHWAKKKRCVCGIFLLIWALMAFFVVVFGEEPWDDDTRWGCTQCYWSEPLATCLLTLGFEVREWQLLFPRFNAMLICCWRQRKIDGNLRGDTKISSWCWLMNKDCPSPILESIPSAYLACILFRCAFLFR